VTTQQGEELPQAAERVVVTVARHGCLLTTDINRMWREYCVANEDHLTKTWSISSETLIASSADHSLTAIAWLCECFGWMDPNLEALRADQLKLLSGRL